jgi:hypothetical protein
MHLAGLQRALFRYCLRPSARKKGSADKRMVNAKGPVWHQQQTQQGILPKGWRGLDREAPWGTSRADGWLDGQGTCSLTPPRRPMVGIGPGRANAGNEATRRAQAIITDAGIVKKSCRDRMADDQPLYVRRKKDPRLQLVTVPRTGMHTSASRQKRLTHMLPTPNTQDDKARSSTVEPRQGLVAEICARARCGLRGEANNRWLFAARGRAVQMAPWRAGTHKRSTWNVQSAVVG